MFKSAMDWKRNFGVRASRNYSISGICIICINVRQELKAERQETSNSVLPLGRTVKNTSK